MEKKSENLPVALTIAGSDSGAGAGIQADLLTIAANGVFGISAISALTAQNPSGVSAVHAVPEAFVREQILQLSRFFEISAAKTGMLFNAEITEVVADFFEKNPKIKLVVDPVMIASSGAKLLENSAIAALRERLIPLSCLATPNLDEAEFFLGEEFSWRKNEAVVPEEISADAEKVADFLGVPVLLKGGHGAGTAIFDVLAFPKICRKNPALSAGEKQRFLTKIVSAKRIQNLNTHGSGCTLSAAISANFAKLGNEISLENVVAGTALGISYIRRAMENSIRVSGENFIAHLR